MDQRVRCSIHEDGADRLFRNIGNDQYTLRTSQESENLKESWNSLREVAILLFLT